MTNIGLYMAYITLRMCIILLAFVPLWLYDQFIMGPSGFVDTVEMISFSQSQWGNPEVYGLNWLTPNHNTIS